MTKPRILIWDLETAPNIAAVFDLFEDNGINFNGIMTERYIICGSWKWLDEPNIESISIADDKKAFKKDPHDDFLVVKKLHEMLSQADAIVAHYGDNFDIKYFNTRAIFHKLDPIQPLIQIDTYKIAKKKFKFNCNRLDYIGKFLGLGRKKHVDFSVWMDALNGKTESITKMVDYNKQDVVLLEDIYKRLSPYVPAQVNHRLFTDSPADKCIRCGSDKIEKRGWSYTATKRYQRYKCNGCAGWFKSYISESKIDEKARKV